MYLFEKAEFNASTRHIDRFLKSGILIYNTEVLEKMGGIIQGIAKCYVLQANATRSWW